MSEAVDDLEDTGILGANVRQFISRLMSGYEAQGRRSLDMCDSLLKRLEQAESVTQRALEMQLKLAQDREELLSAQHTRDLENKLVQQRGDAINELSRDARAMLPLLAKRLMGAPITGNDSHGLQDLLQTMSGDQIEDIMLKGTLQLSEGQRILLGSVLTDLAASERSGNVQ